MDFDCEHRIYEKTHPGVLDLSKLLVMLLLRGEEMTLTDISGPCY